MEARLRPLLGTGKGRYLPGPCDLVPVVGASRRPAFCYELRLLHPAAKFLNADAGGPGGLGIGRLCEQRGERPMLLGG
jgi:hypothetical protein